MITSIVLTGMYNIGISDTGKIKTPDGVTISIKDIPFVRYRFDTYGEKELDFIKKNKEKFPCVHLVELTLNDDTVDIAEAIEEMDENIARIVYVPVTDAEVSRGLTDKQLEILGEVGELEIDRIMIKDKSNSMYELALDKLKKQVKEASGSELQDIGCCGGPCAFYSGNACLTALHAREILARYSERDDIVVPSANHEGNIDKLDHQDSCVNRCGCIRYHVYNSDMPAPMSKTSREKKSTSKKSSGTKTTKKSISKVKNVGYEDVDFW